MYLSYVSIYLSIYLYSIHPSIYQYVYIHYICIIYIYSKKKIRLVLVKKTRTHIVKVRLAPLSPAKQVRFTCFNKSLSKMISNDE